MKLRYKLITLATVGFNVLLTNCAVGGSGSSAPATVVGLTPQITAVAVNSTTTFTVSNSNAASTVWSLSYPLTGSPGTLSSTTGGSIVYTAPSTPPIYANQAGPNSYQGKVFLYANLAGGLATETFYVTAPSITTAISPLAVTVPLGTSLQFAGYAVGGTNNNVTYEVNGVVGGSTATGTITNSVLAGGSTGVYTAPATMPMSGNTVNVMLVSQADPTKMSTAVVTLR